MEIVQAVVSNPFFLAIVGIGLPVLLLPFIMRFIVSTVIVAFSRRKYMAGIIDSMSEGYSSDQDAQALSEVIGFAKMRLARFLAFRSNLALDLEALLITIKNVYERKSDRDKLTFPFSVTRLVECLLLAFTDLYAQYGNAFWYRLIRNTRIVWFVRFSRIRVLWDSIFKITLFEKLRSARILFRIVRILLVPLVGVPFFIWYAGRAVFTSVFLEGAYRFFYSLVIMKAGYYAIHVFGRKNPAIDKRIHSLRGKRLDSAYKSVDRALDPTTWNKWSDTLPEAVDKYAELLGALGIAEDRSFLSEAESVLTKIGKMAQRFAGSIKRAYAKKNPFKKESASIASELLAFVQGISSVYRPGVENPFLYLRIKEIISAGYFASLVVFYGIRKTPLLPSLLDKVSVEFVLNVSAFFRKGAVRKNMKGAKRAYESYQIASIGYKAYQVIRGLAGPVSLALTATSPVVIQQILDIAREYVFHRCGRLAILVWEADLGKRDLLAPDVMLFE